MTTDLTQLQTQPQILSRSYDHSQWQQGYRSLRQEFDYWIDEIEGQIPAALQGTWFRNGPGLFEVGDTAIRHPFDGDGMVCAITFTEGRAHFRNRYVRTQGFEAEQAAGRILYRGVFGTQKPGGPWANAFDLKLKNIANTQVIYWGGKLLALWEGAVPYRLDPATLETIGLDHLEGQLSAGESFAAHPWIDPACALDGGAPCLVNFSIQAGLSFTLNLYELNPQGQIVRRQSHPLPGFAFIHDFAITPNYCLFFQNPVRFNPIPYLLGLRGAGECLQFQPERPTRLIIVPRDGRGPVHTVEMPAGFVFHHANAFEQGDAIVIDSVCYAQLSQLQVGEDFREVDFDRLAPGQLWRFTWERPSDRVQRQLLLERCCEFPVVHPAVVGRPYRAVYLGAAHAATGNAPLQALCKLDATTGQTQLWSAAPHGFVSEPVFVPRSELEAAEDDGWLLTLIYDGAQERSAIVILDAESMQPLARLNLKHHVPYGLHGTFTPETFGLTL
jgi:all-trans-8'-apo-beta-carotenal 15,15'-oxygenase